MILYKTILFVFTLCLAQITSAEHYHFARRIKTTDDGNMNLYTFETVFGIGIGECVQRCKTKKRCKYINYRVRINGCFLIGLVNNQQASFENVLDKEADYIFANMSDWNTDDDSLCEDCIDDGCPFPEEKENARFLGNMYTVGSKGVYTCDEGLAMKSTDISRTTCTINGTWSETKFKCLPMNFYTEDALMLNGTYFKLVRETMTWFQSKQNCEEHGGYLADILSQEEKEIVDELVANVTNNVWIGERRDEMPDQFTWVDGTLVTEGYNNWIPGQPYHPKNEPVCMALANKWNFEWSDGSCMSKYQSICKID